MTMMMMFITVNRSLMVFTHLKTNKEKGHILSKLDPITLTPFYKDYMRRDALH